MSFSHFPIDDWQSRNQLLFQGSVQHPVQVLAKIGGILVENNTAFHFVKSSRQLTTCIHDNASILGMHTLPHKINIHIWDTRKRSSTNQAVNILIYYQSTLSFAVFNYIAPSISKVEALITAIFNILKWLQLQDYFLQSESITILATNP